MAAQQILSIPQSFARRQGRLRTRDRSAPRSDKTESFGSINDLLKRTPFHITAAHNDRGFAGRELLRMKKECCVRNGAAGFSHEMSVTHQPANGFANLV